MAPAAPPPADCTDTAQNTAAIHAFNAKIAPPRPRPEPTQQVWVSHDVQAVRGPHSLFEVQVNIDSLTRVETRTATPLGEQKIIVEDTQQRIRHIEIPPPADYEEAKAALGALNRMKNILGAEVVAHLHTAVGGMGVGKEACDKSREALAKFLLALGSQASERNMLLNLSVQEGFRGGALRSPTTSGNYRYIPGRNSLSIEFEF